MGERSSSLYVETEDAVVLVVVVGGKGPGREYSAVCVLAALAPIAVVHTRASGWAVAARGAG